MIKSIVFVMVLLSIPLTVSAADDLAPKKAPFEKATIHYSINGLEKGFEILYIRDFGKQMARYRFSTMKLMGVEKVTKTVEFIDPDWIYNFDLQRRTATKSANPAKYFRREYTKLNDNKKERSLKQADQLSLGPMLGGMSGEAEENVTAILGYSCDRARFVGARIYSINGTDIPLRTEADIMGMRIKVEAVKIEVNSAPLKFFQHPQDITPVYDPKADRVAQALAEETIATTNGNLPMHHVPSQEKVVHIARQEPDPQEQEEMERAIEILKKTADHPEKFTFPEALSEKEISP